MDSSVVAAVFGIIVAVTIVVVATLAWRRHKKLLAELSDNDRVLHDQCRAADKKVAEVRRRHERAVKAAKTALKEAETPEKTAQIDGRNYVTRIDLRLNGNQHALDERVVAALDSTGDITHYSTQRSTFTRIATGAVIGGGAGAVVGGLARKNTSRQVDNRELYLMVVGPDWQEVVKIDPNLGDKARSMMQSINVNAQNAVSATAAHVEAVARARAELARVTTDTQELEEATAARETLGADPLRTAKENRRRRASPQTQPNGMLLIQESDPSGEGPQDTVR